VPEVSEGRLLHSWDLTVGQAVALQKRLATLPSVRLDLKTPEYVAGVDVAYRKDSGESFATVCLLSFPRFEVVETSTSRLKTPFPYVPGLLSFREVPPLLDALSRITRPIHLVLVDGHGRAHPRRMGIAAHLGLWLRVPTIGVGKSRLTGEFAMPGPARGSAEWLLDRGETIGSVLRTKDGVRPIFVSEGYGIPLEECVRWVLDCCRGYRLPEPIRMADRMAATAKRRDETNHRPAPSA